MNNPPEANETGVSAFSPALIRLQDSAPNPLGRMILWVLLTLLSLLLIWSFIGRLDIVAVADGKLIPESYVKIIQPSEAGIVQEILVHEGDAVSKGQVLMRMDALNTGADEQSTKAELQRKYMTIRRINAELEGKSFEVSHDDVSSELAQQVAAQYQANHRSLNAAIEEEHATMHKAKQDMAAARQVKQKLEETLPYYTEQGKAYDELLMKGYASRMEVSEKRRELIEQEQELKTQEYVLASSQASIEQSKKRITQLNSDYKRQLHRERNEVNGQIEKLVQELAKFRHRNALMELKAPEASIVKDLATHTRGTVVQPGTVLATLVPKDDVLRAEVWVSNQDIGFVREGMEVRLKFASFPFQKFGMADGVVEYVSADAADTAMNPGGTGSQSAEQQSEALAYRTLILLKAMHLEMNEKEFVLSAGMQASAEIILGTRSVIEYLLSPVRKAWHESGRER